MPSYVMPAMPLTARVWFEAPAVPPGVEPDLAEVSISLSPCRPEDWFRGNRAFDPLPATHIIRCLPDGRMGDNLEGGVSGLLFPCTVFECPVFSQHFYAAVWYHEVGAGFPNWHARIYASRLWIDHVPGDMLFKGWI